MKTNASKLSKWMNFSIRLIRIDYLCYLLIRNELQCCILLRFNQISEQNFHLSNCCSHHCCQPVWSNRFPLPDETQGLDQNRNKKKHQRHVTSNVSNGRRRHGHRHHQPVQKRTHFLAHLHTPRSEAKVKFPHRVTVKTDCDS